jgi:hypothetical protein
MKKINSDNIYKLVWLPDVESIFEDIKEDITLTGQNYNELFLALSKFIDLKKWHSDYYSLYKLWLDDDRNDIYDISNSINTAIINAIKDVNIMLKNKSIILFYWFDVDRNIYPDWEWTYDPIDRDQLITLDTSFTKNNRKICLKHFLVFPEGV